MKYIFIQRFILYIDSRIIINENLSGNIKNKISKDERKNLPLSDFKTKISSKENNILFNIKKEKENSLNIELSAKKPASLEVNKKLEKGKSKGKLINIIFNIIIRKVNKDISNLYEERKEKFQSSL